MIYEANRTFNELLVETLANRDLFILGLNRFELIKGKSVFYYDVDYGYVAASDSLEELKRYMIDNNLKSYVQIEGLVVKKRYHYFYEIFKCYGNNKAYIERVESFYDKLYYDGSLNYYKEDALSDAILWRIERGRECFNLDSPRCMGIDKDTIVIFNYLTNEIFETIKIEDLLKRSDIMDEIIRNNFKKVNNSYL